MKILKYIIFLSILSGIFFVVYHQSEKKGFGRVWMSLKMAAEELFDFPYPFQLPKSFLRLESKNDLRLKVRIMKSLAVSKPEKTLDLEEFFIT